MAIDKAIDSVDLDNSITTVANAIRQRGKTNSKLVFPSGMAQAILNIRDAIFLDNIKLTHAANKKDYLVNETFNPAGMVVQANFNNSAYKNVSDYTYSPTGPLSVGTSAITISYTEQGINKTTTQAITVTDKPKWSWGSETAVGNVEWWRGLKEWLGTASESEISGCLGKTKQVTLTKSVCQTTTHTVRVIGYNIDAAKSLTFQASPLSEKVIYKSTGGYSNSNDEWRDYDQPYPQLYYNAFPAKDVLKNITYYWYPQTSTKASSTHPVFYPSGCQVGVTNLCYNKNDEYTSYNTGKKRYQWYSSHSPRMSKEYWLRSYHTSRNNFMTTITTNGGQDYWQKTSGKMGFSPLFVVAG